VILEAYSHVHAGFNIGAWKWTEDALQLQCMSGVRSWEDVRRRREDRECLDLNTHKALARHHDWGLGVYSCDHELGQLAKIGCTFNPLGSISCIFRRYKLTKLEDLGKYLVIEVF
jgi:hypothetical protein